MQETTNYKFKKQELTDKADITQISGNWDTIDAELATIDGKTGGTINGDVSIAGALNMSGPIKTTKAEILQTQVDVTKGEAPAETKYSYISMYDKNGWDNSANRLAHIDYMVGADGAATLNLSVNKFEQAGGETPASLNVRYQADGTPRIFLSHNPKKESNSQDIATTGWVRGLTATTAEYGLVKLADENAALAPTDPLAAVNVPLLYELADYRRLNTAYNVGDCVGCAFQFDLFLECTQAGTTSGDTLDTRTVTHGQTINDGSVIWTVRKAAKSVNGALPDAAGNITITAANISGAVQSVNGVKPDEAGNVTIEQEEVDLSNLVTLNTEQTITGAKTFSTMNVTGATVLSGQTSAALLHVTGAETNDSTLTVTGKATFNGGVAMAGACTAPEPTATSHVATKNYVDNKLTGGAVPPGCIVAFMGTTVPDGYLLCNGAYVSRTTYANLYAAIGTKYGSSGTNFRLPSLTDGRFLEGYSSAGTTHSAGLPNISGSISRDSSSSVIQMFCEPVDVSGTFSQSTASMQAAADSNTWLAMTTTLNFNASRSNGLYGDSSTVQPKSLTCLYIIKT